MTDASCSIRASIRKGSRASGRCRSRDDRKPFKVMQTDSAAGWGQFSPDGKWIAYTSIESGRWEIYLQPFPGPGTKSRISTGGGVMRALEARRQGVVLHRARRSPDGGRRSRFASDGASVEAGTPVPLFTTRVGGALQQTEIKPQYVVAPDGAVPDEYGRRKPKRVAHHRDSELEGEILIG